MTDEPTGVRCDFCDKEVGADCYCHGCGNYICEDCRGFDEPWGSHEPEDRPRPDADD